MKKFAIKMAVVTGTALLGSTLLVSPSQAMADSSWGCPGCMMVSHGR